MVSEQQSDTRVDEIAKSIYRISTWVPVESIPGGFTFNQYLIVDEAPLLFHTGPRRLFEATRAGIERVMPIDRLRYLALSHVEADECGAINHLLAVAPHAVPLCGTVAAMVSIDDMADRPPRAMSDGETLSLGSSKVTWLDTPHLPHGWECGYLMVDTARTLLCGDLFTQPGGADRALIEEDILEASEAMRAIMDYYSHTKRAGAMLDRLASLRPNTLACMHGSAWQGDGARLLRELAKVLERQA